MKKKHIRKIVFAPNYSCIAKIVLLVLLVSAVPGMALLMGSTSTGGSDWVVKKDLPVYLIQAPTTVTRYNPGNKNNNARNLDDGTDVTVTSTTLDFAAFQCSVNPGAGDSGDRVAIHFTADAEL